jgi:hypothetical protein
VAHSRHVKYRSHGSVGIDPALPVFARRHIDTDVFASDRLSLARWTSSMVEIPAPTIIPAKRAAVVGYIGLGRAEQRGDKVITKVSRTVADL